MEYANHLIREAERRQQDKITPYDNQLADAILMRGKIDMLLALMRAEISDHHKKHGEIDMISEQLQATEEGMTEALSDAIKKLQNKIQNYSEQDEANAAWADEIIDERD